MDDDSLKEGRVVLVVLKDLEVSMLAVSSDVLDVAVRSEGSSFILALCIL